MGHDKQNQSQHTTSDMRGAGSQNKGQGQYQGRGLNKDQADRTPDAGQGDWNDRAQRPMQPGDETRPMQPGGASPHDKDEHAVKKNRPVQPNR